MNTYVTKSQEPKNQSDSGHQSMQRGKVESSYQINDNRPETAVQRKLNEIVNNSSQSGDTAQLESTLNQYVHGIFQQINAANESLQLKVKSGFTQHSDNTDQIIQLAPWTNENAKFKTDNGMPDVPNSEYLVEPTSYKRYAPINEVRAPGQMFHEGPRSFAYLYSKDKESKAFSNTEKAQPMKPGNSWIKLSADQESVIASRVPKNGFEVWDGDVTDDGLVTDRHPGHTVTELGMPLPHIETPELLKEARAKQLSVKMAQKLGLVAPDDQMIEDVYKISDDHFGGDDNAALSYLAKHPEVFPELEAAKVKGTLNTK